MKKKLCLLTAVLSMSGAYGMETVPMERASLKTQNKHLKDHFLNLRLLSEKQKSRWIESAEILKDEALYTEEGRLTVENEALRQAYDKVPFVFRPLHETSSGRMVAATGIGAAIVGAAEVCLCIWAKDFKSIKTGSYAGASMGGFLGLLFGLANEHEIKRLARLKRLGFVSHR